MKKLTLFLLLALLASPALATTTLTDGSGSSKPVINDGLEIISTRTPGAGLTGAVSVSSTADLNANGWDFGLLVDREFTGSTIPSAGYHNGGGWARATDNINSQTDLFGMEGRVDSSSGNAVNLSGLFSFVI